MEYLAALDWLYGRQALGIKLGLEKVHKLLAALGDPQEAFDAIHIAGTNGKGSVAAMLSRVLTEAGFKVGTTTSPHLVSFRERIQVDGTPVSEEEVVSYVARLQPAVAALDEAETPPTFFECVTAMAFLHFQQAGVQWGVVETGMGGRLDATNVLSPALTIITQIGMDHEAFLGDNIVDITWEKAGIMKRGVPCVTSATGESLFAIKARSIELQVPMSIIGEDYAFQAANGQLQLGRPTGTSVYTIGLRGPHQAENAATVVAACDALNAAGVFVPERAVQAGLQKARHPGRAELRTIDARRWGGTGEIDLLLDGAHNASAAEALAATLDELAWKDAAAIVAFSKDKPVEACLNAWRPYTASIHPALLQSPRAMDLASWQRHGLNAAPVEEALRAAVATGARQILVAGSLFLVGEMTALLEGLSAEETRGTQ